MSGEAGNLRALENSTGPGDDASDGVIELIGAYQERMQEHFKKARDEATASYDSAVFMLISVVIAAIMIGVTAAIWLSLSISRGLGKAVDLANAVAIGDLDQKIAVNTNDEVKDLVDAMTRMTENLNATLESTRRLTQELASPNGTVLRTVDSVGHDLQGAAASVQTAAGNFSQETLPQLNGLARDARQTARSFERAAGQFNDSPTSVLFGAPAPTPGPGEPGFSTP